MASGIALTGIHFDLVVGKPVDSSDGKIIDGHCLLYEGKKFVKYIDYRHKSSDCKGLIHGGDRHKPTGEFYHNMKVNSFKFTDT